jgi:MFS family permease
MEEMLHHAKAVVRGTRRAMVIGDLPFLSYATPEDALSNAGRFLREAGVQAVKVEGGVRAARIIETLARAGIPVMGHIGLTPQAINALGKVRVQGKTREQARALVHDARAVQEAGAFAVVLELVPAPLAAAITAFMAQVSMRRLFLGAGAFSILFAMIALSRIFVLSAVLLTVLGFSGITFTMSANTLLQLKSPDALRGRIMSVYVLLFMGSTPIGGFLIGALSDTFGVQAALLTCAVFCLAGVGIAWFYYRASLRRRSVEPEVTV